MRKPTAGRTSKTKLVVLKLKAAAKSTPIKAKPKSKLKSKSRKGKRMTKTTASPALVAARGESEKTWTDVDLALKHARRVLLWGPPGTGKSYGGTNVDKGVELFRLYITMDTPAAEVRGHYLPNEGGSFSWHDGPGVAAWRAGGRLVVDEIDAASGDTLTLLMGLLDDPESAMLTLPTNETLRPKAGFSCVATTNQLPSVMPEALLDRFDVVINVMQPSPKVFSLGKWHNKALARAAENSIFLTREVPKGKEGRAIGLRAFRAIDRLNEAGLPLPDASRLVIGESASRWLMTSMAISK